MYYFAQFLGPDIPLPCHMAFPLGCLSSLTTWQLVSLRKSHVIEGIQPDLKRDVLSSLPYSLVTQTNSGTMWEKTTKGPGKQEVGITGGRGWGWIFEFSYYSY